MVASLPATPRATDDSSKHRGPVDTSRICSADLVTAGPDGRHRVAVGTLHAVQ